MESVVSYAKDVSTAIKYYVSINGLDDTAEKIYDYIQNITSIDESQKNELDLFIADYTVDSKHLADITYVNNSGENALIFALSRMKPYKVCKPNQNFYEARGNNLQALNNKKSVKVIKRTYPKKAA